MDAFVYQSDIFCADCAVGFRSSLHCELVALADKDGNSDMAPQGPYSDGGGEADCPQHCGMCGVFLENPLTDDGRAYVVERLADGDGDADVLTVWREFYGTGAPYVTGYATAEQLDEMTDEAVPACVAALERCGFVVSDADQYALSDWLQARFRVARKSEG